MDKQALNPIGGVVTITKAEQQILDTRKYNSTYGSKYRKVTNLNFKNIGNSDLIFKINKGEKMILKPNQGYIYSNLAYSLIIYTNNAKLQWSANMDEPYREE